MDSWLYVFFKRVSGGFFGVILCLFVCFYPVTLLFLDHSLSADVESVFSSSSLLLRSTLNFSETDAMIWERKKPFCQSKEKASCIASLFFAITVMQENAFKLCSCKYLSWLYWILLMNAELYFFLNNFHSLLHYSNADLWWNVLNLHANNVAMQKKNEFSSCKILFLIFEVKYELSPAVFLNVTHTHVFVAVSFRKRLIMSIYELMVIIVIIINTHPVWWMSVSRLQNLPHVFRAVMNPG